MSNFINPWIAVAKNLPRRFLNVYELIIKVTNSKCCSAKTKRLTGHYKKRGRKKGADRRRTGAKLNEDTDLYNDEFT